MTMFCGIDWSERHHDVAIVDADGALVARQRIGDDAAGLGRLLDMLALAGDGPDTPIPVAIETSRGSLVACLRATGRPMFVINPLVGDHPIGPAPRTPRTRPRHSDRRQDLPEGGAVVDIAGREHDRQRQAASVDRRMDLGGQAAPSAAHRRYRSYTVFQLPYRSGRSRHGAPVAGFHKIPFSTYGDRPTGARPSFPWPSFPCPRTGANIEQTERRSGANRAAGKPRRSRVYPGQRWCVAWDSNPRPTD